MPAHRQNGHGHGAPRILIAALAARALAATARRSGFVPLAADSFGDRDLDEICEATAAPCGDLESGFQAEALVEALDRLAVRARTPPIGLVLGAGFEDRAALIARLGGRFQLLGCCAEAVWTLKEPRRFFPLLKRCHIPHPETRLAPPERLDGWLAKRTGASGGAHVRWAAALRSHDPTRTPEISRPTLPLSYGVHTFEPAPFHAIDRGLEGDGARAIEFDRIYFQRHVSGRPVSLLAVAWRGGIVPVGFTEQWLSPTASAPFRYGGALGPISPPPAASARMIEATERIVRGAGLLGLVSADFLIEGEDAVLLEVNPRPGATLDVLDPPGRRLFAAHVAAASGGQPQLGLEDGRVRAAAIVYHDGERPITAPEIWPAWCADRGRPGTQIPPGGPLCTVLADAADAEAARALVLRRARRAKRLAVRHDDREAAPAP